MTHQTNVSTAASWVVISTCSALLWGSAMGLVHSVAPLRLLDAAGLVPQWGARVWSVLLLLALLATAAAVFSHRRQREITRALVGARAQADASLRAQWQALRTIRCWHRGGARAGWGMVVTSADAHPLQLRVNRAYARMLGYRPAELVGKPVRDFVRPSDWDAVLHAREAAQQGRSMQVPVHHRHRNGMDISTLVSWAAVQDAQGQPTHFVLQVQDISALAPTAQEAQWRALLDALPVPFWVGDTQGLVQQTNRAAQALWNGGADGTDAPCDPRRIPLDHQSLMRRAIVLNQPVSSEVVDLPTPGGHARTLVTTARPVLDASGRILGAIAVDEDVTRLRDAEAALRHSKELLVRIIDACMVGVALIDGQGAVAQANMAWRLLLGEVHDSQSLQARLEPQDPLRAGGLLEQVARGEVPTYAGEHRMQRASGEAGWTLLMVSRLHAGASPDARLLVQVLDIDARRRMTEEIAGSNLRLAAAQRLARMGDWLWERESDRVRCSDEALRILGLARQSGPELTGAGLRSLVHPEDLDRLVAASESALRSFGSMALDLRMLRSDQVEVTVHMRGVAHRTSAGLTISGTLQDISERKAIESELRESRERLRELVAHEGELIEEERKRIAREVHDELGQLLAALRMDLSMLRAQTPVDSPVSDRVNQMRDTMATMTDVVRHVASNLRPAALDMGLTAAIEWLAEDFSLRWEIQCDVRLCWASEPDLADSVSLALFRAVQESLTNVAKHAQARQVHIRMTESAGALQLCVSDDGRGFDVPAVTARRGAGLGLLGMRERMHTIGAQLDIRSGPGGTLLTIHYPLNARATHESH